MKENTNVRITLNDIGIGSNACYVKNPLLEGVSGKLIESVLLFPPTNQSHFGNNLDSFSFHHRDYKEFCESLMLEIIKKLKIKSLFFTSFESKQNAIKNKTDFAKRLCEEESLILYCNNNCSAESFFCGFRNALAHGNLIKRNNLFHFYSVSSSTKFTNGEYSKPITFFLTVIEIQKINKIYRILDKYR